MKKFYFLLAIATSSPAYLSAQNEASKAKNESKTTQRSIKKPSSEAQVVSTTKKDTTTKTLIPAEPKARPDTVKPSVIPPTAADSPTTTTTTITITTTVGQASGHALQATGGNNMQGGKAGTAITAENSSATVVKGDGKQQATGTVSVSNPIAPTTPVEQHEEKPQTSGKAGVSEPDPNTPAADDGQPQTTGNNGGTSSANGGTKPPEKDPEDDDTEGNSNLLGGLINYNFSQGNKKLGNFTPVVDYGWSATLLDKAKHPHFNIDFNANPYIAGQIDVKDSSAYIPAMMLPGNAGIKVNFILRITQGDFTFFGSPANFGFKLLSNFADSTQILAQHNIRQSLGIAFKNDFILGAQWTRGWHNGTSESEKLFENIFSKKATDIKYLTVTMQLRLKIKKVDNPTILYGEWRSLLDKNRFPGFSNVKIITLGIRSDISLDKANPSSSGGGRGRTQASRSFLSKAL